MDHFVAATVAENRLDFTALVARDGARVGGGIGAEAAADLRARAVADQHRIAALEIALDGDDARGKKRGAAPERRRRAVVDRDAAGGVEHAGDPALARGQRLGRGQEPGAARAALD